VDEKNCSFDRPVIKGKLKPEQSKMEGGQVCLSWVSLICALKKLNQEKKPSWAISYRRGEQQ